MRQVGLTTLLMLVGCGSPTPKHPGPAAKKMHIQGSVEVRAIISKAGNLKNIEVLKGDPLFVPAALTAVKKWRYTPCLLYHEAVDVVTVLDISFNLNQ